MRLRRRSYLRFWSRGPGVTWQPGQETNESGGSASQEVQRVKIYKESRDPKSHEVRSTSEVQLVKRSIAAIKRVSNPQGMCIMPMRASMQHKLSCAGILIRLDKLNIIHTMLKHYHGCVTLYYILYIYLFIYDAPRARIGTLHNGVGQTI